MELKLLILINICTYYIYNPLCDAVA